MHIPNMGVIIKVYTACEEGSYCHLFEPNVNTFLLTVMVDPWSGQYNTGI